MIIALEGVDAAGKQTQAKALTERLRTNGVMTETWDFPHYTGFAGGVVGRVLRGETMVVTHDDLLAAGERELPNDGLDLDRLASAWSLDKALVIQAVMLADRCEHIELLRAYQHSRDRVLVLDRYIASAYVYGYVDGLPSLWLATTHAVLPQPDTQILLDIPVEESMRRRPTRQDYYEKNLPKLERVRARYLELLGNRKHDHVIDGTLAPEIITDILYGIVVNRLDETLRIRLTDKKP